MPQSDHLEVVQECLRKRDLVYRHPEYDDEEVEAEELTWGHLRALVDECRRLREDAALLDWLESKGCTEIECSIDDAYAVGHDQIDDGDFYPNLREAIAAAKAGSAGKENS